MPVNPERPEGTPVYPAIVTALAEHLAGDRYTWTADELVETIANDYALLHERVRALEAERDRLRTLVQLLAAADWPGLLALAISWGVPNNYDHPHNLEDYELEGDYSTDARYVYPSREALVYALAGRALVTEGDE